MRKMTALIKPASSMCNLQCSYCFYRCEAENRTKNPDLIMQYSTAENLIKKIFDFCGNNSEITFMFQGGEPLLAGMDFFKFFVEKAEEFKTDNTEIFYSLQTNGTLLNDELCGFFQKNNFLIGVSVDGEKALHDEMRDNSFNDAMNGIGLLKKHNVAFNILSVITAKTDAYKLFDFYKENGFRSVQPIYCLDSLDGQKSDYSLDPKGFARFRKRFFNRWFDEIGNGGQFYVRDFDNLLSLLTSGKAEQCGATGRCNAQLVIEADGTCYPCDFYCLDEFECPNINEADINDILLSDGLRKFMEYDVEKNKLCSECPVKPLCGGGCKRYRSLYNLLSGYCPQMDFIIHAVNKLQKL